MATEVKTQRSQKTKGARAQLLPFRAPHGGRPRRCRPQAERRSRRRTARHPQRTRRPFPGARDGQAPRAPATIAPPRCLPGTARGLRRRLRPQRLPADPLRGAERPPALRRRGHRPQRVCRAACRACWFASRAASTGCGNAAGGCFADRYHDHILKSPREVRNALRYVLGNARHHAALGRMVAVPQAIDTYTSAPWFDGFRETIVVRGIEAVVRPVTEAHTWLLTIGWRRHGLLSVAERPA